jgi:tetratricopeptide (TPR) repeat protein
MNRKIRRLQNKEAKKKGRLLQNPAEVAALQGAQELYQSGRIDQAVQTLINMLRANPKNLDGVNLLAYIHADMGNIDAAVPLFKEATLINPEKADAHFNLGRALDDAGMMDEAIASYSRSLKIDPDRVDALINLGGLFNKTGDLKNAADRNRQAIKIEPDNALAHCNLGGVLKDMGQFEKATKSCTRAITINPSMTAAHYNLACIYLEMAHIADAANSFQETLNLNPDHLEAWNGLELVAKVGVQDAWKNSLNDGALSTVNFELLEYSLQKFRPHEAEEQFKKAMATLPAIVDEELHITKKLTGPETSSKLSKNIVALFHFGRSGTGLFHSLIDGHPEISSLPSIYLRGFFNSGVWNRIARAGWQGLPERFAHDFAVLFDASSPKPTPGMLYEVSSSLGIKEGMANVGEGRNEVLSVDQDKFCAAAYSLIQAHDKIDAGTFFLIVHAAYEIALGASERKNTVFYHIHNPDDFAIVNFLRYKPTARLVIMVREPLQCCESWLRSTFADNNYKDMVHRIITMLFSLDQVAFRTQDSIGVRLEDLKNRPEDTMQAFCNWIGIKEAPSLYEMTAQGNKWWGDPASPDFSDNEAMPPFGKSSITRAVGTVFDEMDQFVLGTFFYPISVHFGYREADPDGFVEDLKKVRPLLDNMLGFEKAIAEKTNTGHEAFKGSSSYLRLRAGFMDRWNVLNEHKDYPNIIHQLKV